MGGRNKVEEPKQDFLSEALHAKIDFGNILSQETNTVTSSDENK